MTNNGRISGRPTLLVLASTYPRWRDDPEPGFVHELCKRLVARFKVIALVPDAPGADPSGVLDGVHVIRYRYAPRAFQTLVNHGGIVTNLRGARWKALLVPPMLLAQVWHARRLVRALRVPVIHAHWLIPQGIIAAFLRGRRARGPSFVVTTHGADLFALRGRWFDSVRRFVIGRAAATTVVSNAMRDELARLGVDPGRIQVQPMGVDLTGRFTPHLSEPRSSREILFVGRLVEKKGLRYLLEAMPAVLSATPDAHVTVAGFGPEEESLRELTRVLGLDCVEFAGPVSQDHLPAFYRRAAVLVAPFIEARSGDQEGLGLVVIEAIGCGCPVIVSDLKATRDVLPGSSGCARVAPADSGALAQAIVQVLASPEMHRAAVASDRQRVVGQFDWSAVSDRYAGIIDKAITRDH